MLPGDRFYQDHRHVQQHTQEEESLLQLIDFNCSDSLFEATDDANALPASLTDGSPGKIKMCPHCSYKTHNTSHLKRHLLCHTGEKPFACPICPYRSVQKVGIQKHMLTHTGEKPFHCPHCDYRACRKDHLQQHVRIRHVVPKHGGPAT